MKILTILGTRPEIIKLSPVIPLLDKEFNHVLIHTGQHYDYNMDMVFFEELNLRKADYLLKIGSGSPIYQISEAIKKLEHILIEEKPDKVLVFGDTNAPISGALVSSKLNLFLVHLEAGCRCFNQIPEETNRIVTDHCSDLLLVPDKKAHENLINEGIPKNKIITVGSTAIESSLRNIRYAKKSEVLKNLELIKYNYILCTTHRAEITNNKEKLSGIINAINEISKQIKVVFPVHPRTNKVIKRYGIKLNENMKIIKPQGYLDFLKLLKNCLFTITDSGGIQEEAAALNTPCLICREETEWTYLTDIGKNILVGTSKENIVKKAKDLLENRDKLDTIRAIKVNLDDKISTKIIRALKNENP